MFKVDLANAIGLGGIALGTLIVVLDKAGKLKGPWLFVLLFAAGVMTLFLAVGNSWVLDAPGKWRLWRGALMFAVVAFAYTGVAIWISGTQPEEAKSGSPASGSTPEADPYKADAGTIYFLPSVFWGVYKTEKGDTVTPIDVVANFKLVNNQKVPASLTSFAVEVNTPRGWMLLKRVPLDGVALYYGALAQARLIKLEPAEIYAELQNAEITAGRTVRGTAIFEYSDPNYVARPREGLSDLRFTIKDTAGHTAVIESTPKSQSSDPRSNVESMALVWDARIVDLSHLPMRRFNAP